MSQAERHRGPASRDDETLQRILDRAFDDSEAPTESLRPVMVFGRAGLQREMVPLPAPVALERATTVVPTGFVLRLRERREHRSIWLTALTVAALIAAIVLAFRQSEIARSAHLVGSRVAGAAAERTPEVVHGVLR
jgi:hypothetical protein